jgi:hypothetical protein
MTTWPVWTANTVVAFVTALIALFVAFGLDLSEEQKGAIIAVVGFVAPFVAAWWSDKRTTSLSQPTDEDGTPLVRADTHQPTRAQVRSMAR